jgi:hypothetical protein
LQKRAKSSRYEPKLSIDNSIKTQSNPCKDLKKDLMMSRNSFIPTTNIKSHIQFVRDKIAHHVPLHPL